MVWTIPSPYRLQEGRLRRCPSSLYTFRLVKGGLARDYQEQGFPEFEQFCIAGFPREHPISFKSAASTNFATPARPGGRCVATVANPAKRESRQTFRRARISLPGLK